MIKIPFFPNHYPNDDDELRRKIHLFHLKNSHCEFPSMLTIVYRRENFRSFFISEVYHKANIVLNVRIEICLALNQIYQIQLLNRQRVSITATHQIGIMFAP